MTPISSIEEAQRFIAAYIGPPSSFSLPISDELQDQYGINMAIITDASLARGWEPDGFIQNNGFRSYKFKGLRP